MIIRQSVLAAMLAGVVAASWAPAAFGQEKGTLTPNPKAAASPSPAAEDMGQMMADATPGENHKLLAGLVGTWTYKVKFWWAPGSPPSESAGVSNCKPVLDGHYFISDSEGKFQMPGADGQMQGFDFKGMALDGYDNAKKKFVADWIDNMGTSIAAFEGTYDAGTKTFTYHGEEESTPGTKTKVRETMQILDPDHHVLEWYEEHGGKEVKMMEISYTRQS
jgi:hypothetical protein